MRPRLDATDARNGAVESENDRTAMSSSGCRAGSARDIEIGRAPPRCGRRATASSAPHDCIIETSWRCGLFEPGCAKPQVLRRLRMTYYVKMQSVRPAFLYRYATNRFRE